MTEDVQVTDDPGRGCFVVRVDGKAAGSAFYELNDGEIVFTHTEVDAAYGGQGIGSQLVRAALDDSRRRGRRVVPQCPFVARWIQRHPDYADLVAD